jgi:hypothetical protein
LDVGNADGEQEQLVLVHSFPDLLLPPVDECDQIAGNNLKWSNGFAQQSRSSINRRALPTFEDFGLQGQIFLFQGGRF